MNKPIPMCCLAVALMFVSSACDSSFQEVRPSCEGWRAGDVVITELLPDPEGADTGQEWVELHNPGLSAVDLRGLLLYVARADGSQERAYLFEASVPVESKGYGVLGDVRSEALPSHVSHSYGDTLGSLSNSGGLVGLRCGDVVVDEVLYTGPVRSGVARSYDGSRWCDAPTPVSGRGPRGSPGAPNPACPPPTGGADGGVSADAGVPWRDTCQSPSTGTLRSVASPRPGDLVLTEIMANPKTVEDASGEWVEVYALRDVDLNGVTLENEGTGRALLGEQRCLELRAGTFGVLARNANALLNGGLPPVLGTFGFSLGNSAEAHALRLMLDGVLLDGVVWTSAPVSGVSRQLAPSLKDPLRNDAESSFCLAPEGALYGTGDRGTPGAENHRCGP